MLRIDDLARRADHLTDAKNSPAPPPATAAAAPEGGSGFLVRTQGALVAGVTIVVLTLFLLAAGPPVLARMSATFATNLHYSRVLQVIEAVRSEVGRYYATIGLINLGLALATSAAMFALGMPNPVLWGVMAGVLNFIPYVGVGAIEKMAREKGLYAEDFHLPVSAPCRAHRNRHRGRGLPAHPCHTTRHAGPHRAVRGLR